MDETAKREHEPVGYVTDSGKSAYILLGVDLEDDTPLYTAPPKAAEWVGLTEKDKDELVESLPDFYSVEDVIAAIEAKLKEKNGG